MESILLIKKEIERLRRKNHSDADNGCNEDECSGYELCLDHLLSFIESLEKEQEPVDLVSELKHHLATTPKEQLQKEWDDLKEWGNIGPTVNEFLYGKDESAPKIKGWVARDSRGVLELFKFQPHLLRCDDGRKLWRANVGFGNVIPDIYPEVTLENSPIEVELTIRKV